MRVEHEQTAMACDRCGSDEAVRLITVGSGRLHALCGECLEFFFGPLDPPAAAEVEPETVEA